MFCRMERVQANSKCPHSVDGVHVGVTTDATNNTPVRPTIATVRAHAPLCKCMASTGTDGTRSVKRMCLHQSTTLKASVSPPKRSGELVGLYNSPCVSLASGNGDLISRPLSKAWRSRLRGLVEAENPHCLMAQILRNSAPKALWPIGAPQCAIGESGRGQ